jgi:glutamine cyclotransferase
MSLFKYLPLLLILGCGGGSEEASYDPDIAPPPPAPLISYSIIDQLPHDTGAYTQGLEFHNGKLFEGTGDYENSSLRIVSPESGKPEKRWKLKDPALFGEGITIFNGKLYQLTWQNNIAFVYDMKDLDKPAKQLNWPYEGWGITHNEKELIISDGSANLFFTDPENLRVLRTVTVTENGRPIERLNELEFVDGAVFANVYTSNEIVKIDPVTGNLLGRMMLENLLTREDFVPGRTDVLNGIAYDSTTKAFYITGKRWPRMFRIKISS